MLKNYNIDPIPGTLTETDVLRICNQLGGNQNTILHEVEAPNIAHGEFLLTISLNDLELAKGCIKHVLSSNENFLRGENVTLTFKCVIVQQPNTIIQCLNYKDAVRTSILDFSDAGFTPSMPILLLFENYEGYTLDYCVYADSDLELAGTTIFVYEQIESSSATFDEEDNPFQFNLN